ncbi:MAG: DUF4625 domain-containing protein [Marinilabilia sp.]
MKRQIEYFSMRSFFARVLLFLAMGANVFFFSSCGDDKDDIYPVIYMSGENAFPLNCSVVRPGESFTFRAVFSDNRELGAYSIEIHHNFDHHTHSTDVVECEMEPEKEPDQPFQFIEEYEIPPGQKHYEAEVEISVPDTVDRGDYHFMIRLTDASGWQTLKGISIKIMDEEE